MITRKFLSKLIPALPMLLAAALVILVTVIFLATMRSKAHAQFGGIEQPMFQLTSSQPQTPTVQLDYLKHYWAYTNITNATIDTWIDSVSGYALYASETHPVSNQFGVYFDGATGLRATNFWLLSSNAIWVLMYPQGASAAEGSLWRSESRATAWMFEPISSGTVRMHWFESTSFDKDIGNLTASNLVDVMIFPDNTNDVDDGYVKIYTNGVLSIQETLGQPVSPITKFGRDPIWQGFRGGILEMALYTNIFYTNVSSTVSNLHWYATNKYGFSP